LRHPINVKLSGATMIRKFNVLVLSLAATLPAFAMDAAQSEVKQAVPLVNGETLYVFKDGNMAKANQFGRTAYLAKGEVVQSVDGQKISTIGNEVARLDALARQGHRN
jgi:predicted lipoprotein with Yx(FWY)xxD motif